MTVLQSPEYVSARLIDVQAAADLLGCSTRHVYRLSDAGRMPAPVKLGALVRWNRSAIESWIDQGCRPVHHTTGRLTTAKRGAR